MIYLKYKKKLKNPFKNLDSENLLLFQGIKKTIKWNYKIQRTTLQI